MKPFGKIMTFILACTVFFSVFTGCSNDSTGLTLTNVSYDPTRELYEAYNTLFTEYWLKTNNQNVTITQSHGGSGSQALAVVNGLEADVVTLALEGDVQSVADAGLINEGWIDEFGNDSAPYTSTIVFVVRTGNPRSIKDWDDLTGDGVGVITPNPKTSGGARWNFLAAWAFAENLYGEDEASILQFMKNIYNNVLVLDSGARSSTNTFAENGQGDVLLAWENEAYLLLKEYPDKYEVITPSISILCQPTVAVVDKVADTRGTQTVSAAYLKYLYSDEAQNLIAQNYYRPSNQDILKEYSDVFDLNINLIEIGHFGGWTEAQSVYFSDGGIFDQIYEK